jgi:hypothetical protein
LELSKIADYILVNRCSLSRKIWLAKWIHGYMDGCMVIRAGKKDEIPSKNIKRIKMLYRRIYISILQI